MAIFTDQLEKIDGILAKKDVDLSSRPMEALAILLDHCLETRYANGTAIARDQIWVEPWGRELVGAVDGWYRRRYGKALDRKDHDFRSGLVVVLGVPFRLRIPLVIRESADKPGHAWFRIPNELRPGEEPLAWMNSAPNAPALPARARAAMAKDLAEVVRLTRSIHVDVFSLSRKTEPFAGLIDTVQSHLSKAVDDIYAVKPPRAGAAMWELHLAMEKVLKAYLAQRGQAFKLTHDLRPLYKQALAAGLPAMEAGLVGSLPASKTSIRHRYGQGPPPSISAAYGAYRRALQVVRHCTSNLQHTLHMTNTAFLIKALWLEAEPKR